MPALEQQLLAAITECLFYFFLVLLNRCDVRFRMTGHAVKVAELAVCNAYVSRIHIAVDDPCYFIVGMKMLPYVIRNCHEFGKRSMFKKELPFTAGEKIKLQGTLQKKVNFHGIKMKIKTGLTMKNRNGKSFQ